MIRKYGAGEVLGTPQTEDDPQGITRTARQETAAESWTEQDAVELTQENRES